MIFLDNNATTPILPAVVEAISFDFDGKPRNPSSITFYGREAKEKLIAARRTVAAYFQLSPEEIYFTSSGTESNHMLIHGFYQRNPGPIVSSPIEHASVLEPLRPYKPIFLNIDASGAPNIQEIETTLIRVKPSFLMLSAANTETGVMIPLEEISALCESLQIPLLIDGVGLLGKTPCSPLPKGVSAISFSGHKCHGPKGIGIAIIRKKFTIPPLFKGGHQERNMRAGTENLGGILGLAKAISLIDTTAFAQMQKLRDHFEQTLLKQFPYIIVNGSGNRLPNTSNLYFSGIEAENLLFQLDQKGVIASLGSACSAGALEPSHVLLGMGFSKERALSSLRFSLSRLTTQQEIDRSLEILSSCLCI